MLQGPTPQEELKRRGKRGAKSLVHYPGYLERTDLLDDEDFVCLTIDLITDLLHLAKMKWQADPNEILRMALMNFEAEQAGEM